MPNLLNVYQLGKHVTSVTLDGCTLSGVALTAVGSPVNLTTKWKSYGLNLEPEKAEIGPSNSTRHNNVVLADGWYIDFTVLRVNDGTDPSPMRTLVLTYEYLKAVIVVGTGSSQRTITVYGSRGAYNEPTEGRGEQVATLRLDCVDVGPNDFFAIA